MIRNALARLARASLPPRQLFSQTNTPSPTPKPQSQPQTPTEPQPPRREPREEDEEEEQPLQKQNRNTVGWWIYRLFFWGAFSALTYNVYLVYHHKAKTPVADEPGALPVFVDVAQGLVNNYHEFIEFVTQPPSRKLLPDPPHPDLHPKTLVFNLNGTIISTEYVFGKGQKVTLRPGLQNMFMRLAQKYEIIIFAEEDEPMIMGAVMKVDPRMMFLRGVLGRESMVWRDGSFVKDLRYLNRDLRKVIAIDRTRDNVKDQPNNTIILPQFKGESNDHELQKLTLLLERLAMVPDVRKSIEALGENPVDTYYDRVKQQQEKITKKAGWFGLGGSGKAQKGKKSGPSQEQL